MNLPCITRHVMFFWMLLSHEAHSFAPFSVSNHRKSQLYWRENNIQRPYAFTLPVTASTKADDESSKDATIDADSEKEIVLNFVDMVQSTPAGELQVDEIDLLREIMSDFSGDSQPAWVVESLLRRLLKEWEAALQNGDSEKEEAFRPTAQDFFVAIAAWEKSHNPDKVIHVLSILSDQRELFLNDLPTVQPDLPTIKRVMGILADSRERGVDKRASQVFESLADFGLTADPDIFGLMVTILAKSRTRGAAQRAETLLREAVELYPPQMVNGEVTGIGVEVFNVIVTAYAKGGEESGPEQAQQFIVWMDQLDSENGSLGICSPNVNTFTSLIDAYAQTNEWDEVSQADRTLNRLLDQYMEGNDDLEPNVATWTIVISAWARLSKKNRRGAADRAGRLLKRMEALSQEGRISFKPDAITYVTCMNAYAFSKDDNCAAEAEKILDEMNEMYLDGDDSMKPSARSVKVVTDSWIKAGDMESAEDFLDRYEDVLLSDDSVKMAQELNDLYRSLLFGYTQQDNIERARFYLDYMIEQGMQPDSFCFDRIIDANTRIAGEDGLKTSLEIFELVEKCRRSGDLQPNERVYTTFIRALTKGRAQGLDKKASMLLQRMHQLHKAGNEDIRPTVFTYNAVLNACAMCLDVEDTPRGEAFKTAVKVFTELRNGEERQDHVTFGNMLRCAKLLPEGGPRDKFVSATFRLCCEQGFLNTFTVRDLQLTAPEELWRSLLDCPAGDVDFERLPREWSFVNNEKGGNQRGDRGGGRGRGDRGGGRGRGDRGGGRGRGDRGGGRGRASGRR